MSYGLRITPSDTGITMNLSTDIRTYTVIDNFTMSTGGGTKSYTQSITSGGVPSGSNMSYLVNWAGYTYYARNNFISMSVSNSSRTLKWNGYPSDRFSPATCLTLSDMAGSYTYSGEYGLYIGSNSIKNVLITNNPVYCMIARGTYSAGSKDSVLISNNAFSSPTALIFARDTGGNFLALRHLIGNTITVHRGADEIPTDYGDIGTRNGSIEWVVFDKYTQGTKPSFGLELRRKDGVIGYRSEKSLLIIRGVLKHPYQSYLKKSIGSGYAYTYQSAGGGYATSLDVSNKPMLLLSPSPYREFSYTNESANGYTYSIQCSAGLRVDSNGELTIGKCNVTGGFDSSYYTPSWDSKDVSSVDLKIPFVWRNDYFT